MTNHCLIIIDMLVDFLGQWDQKDVDRLIKNTNALAHAFRMSKLPVIWVRQEFKPDLSDAFLEMRDKQIFITIEGTQGAQLHPDLDSMPDDLVIIKKRYSAFFKTELDEYLTSNGIDEVVFGGINTHECIRMAAIDAYQRDLRVVLANDCIGSYDEEHARVSINYMTGKIARRMTNAEIIVHLSES